MTDAGATYIQDYEFLEQLGAGGFAKVYRARQKSTAQEVAVKVMKLEPDETDTSRNNRLERFRRETRLCAELHHPNIVPLVDSGQTEDGLLYVVFALVPGRDLAGLLKEQGALEPAEALHLMTQVMDAMSCAHAHGIVHRDLKPENIMVSATGARRNALVLDFGIGSVLAESHIKDLTRLTQTGEYVGTPAYSAPEQLLGQPPMLASDLYSWGIIFIECLTGASAFGQGSCHEILHRQLNAAPVPIPDALQGSALGRLLARVTRKDPARRGVTAAETLGLLLEVERSQLPRRGALQPGRWEAATQAGPAGDTTRTLDGTRWLVPLGRNPNFVGRGAMLSAVAQLFATSRSAVVALHGLGGVGKSQLALEFGYSRMRDYDLVAWLRSEVPQTLSADYGALCGPLGLPETPDERQNVATVRAWLERNERWLLIFDNVPNPAALKNYLPRMHGGHILVTSRHQSWRGLAASVPVRVLEPEEAVEFLLQRTGDSSEPAARELAADLGQLPLALEEAAAYIDATGRTIEGYVALFRSHRERVSLGSATTMSHPNLRMTWELSFRAVEQDGPVAADLLKLCAFLAPDDVPYFVFRAAEGKTLPGFGDRLSDDIALDACIATLRRYSLLQTEADAFSMHRLVQLVTRDRLTAAERQHYARWALELMDAAYPVNAIAGDASPRAGRLLPHALSVLGHLPDLSQCAAVAARVLRRSGIYKSARGLHVEARDHLRRALALSEGPETAPIELGGILWELGLVSYAIGDTTAARSELERALAVLRTVGTPQAQIMCAQSLIGLAWVLRTLGEFEQALAAASACCALARARAGKSHAVVPMSLALMARSEWSLNRLAAARAHMLEARQELDGLEDALPLVCGTWYTLAQLHYDFAEWDQAFECAGRGREIGERAYGQNHSLVALNYYVLGLVLARRGDSRAAQQLLQSALDGADRTSPYMSEDLALAQVELARTTCAGAPDRAVALLTRALERLPRVSMSRARFEGVCRAALAAGYREQGQLEAAETECNTGLGVLEAAYGSRHPLRMLGLNELGRIRRAAGREEEARAAFSEAIAIGTEAGLESHPEFVESCAHRDTEPPRQSAVIPRKSDDTEPATSQRTLVASGSDERH